MRTEIDRRWLLLGMAVIVLLIQLLHPTEANTIWPPLLFVLASIYMYRGELKAYDWWRLRSGTFWQATFFAVTQGMIAQAVGIVAVQYGLGVSAPLLPFELGFGVMFSAIVFSAILEELVYRKSVFGLLERRISYWPAAVVSSVLFAAAHANYSAYLGYFLLGLVWCRAYRKTGTVGVPIAAHMIFNLIALLVMHARG